MKNLPQHNDSKLLQEQLSTAEMRNQLAQQVCKDLDFENDFDCDTDLFFKNLYEAAYRVMLMCVEKNPQQLAQTIYRVDLDERQVRRILETEHSDPVGKLTEAIIAREMKKVYIRNVYSGKIKV